MFYSRHTFCVFLQLQKKKIKNQPYKTFNMESLQTKKKKNALWMSD